MKNTTDSLPAVDLMTLVRRCAVCGCSRLFYGRRPVNGRGPEDRVLHWKMWEKKGLTPPHDVKIGEQPRHACSGGGKPYVENPPNAAGQVAAK